MPDIKTLKRILRDTPMDQAIMLEGIHGIGKSEFIKQYAEEEGFDVVVTIYGGEVSDAGDIIGLPDRTEITLNNGQKAKITEFCPPSWWPFDSNKKVLIFLDEYKRSKPEIKQCFMDMTLNYKLNGRPLPVGLTRIIVADNPNGDDYGYDVGEIDPAQLDRFNRYEFCPSVDEWIDWAQSKRVHKYIIGFILKHKEQLDPPKGNSMKIGEVYPSRRSWKRVSDILNFNKDIINEEKYLQEILFGIIGLSATSLFLRYVKEEAKCISPGSVITNWNESLAEKVKKMNITDVEYLNSQLMMWFEENGEDILDEEVHGKKNCTGYTLNLEKYLSIIPAEMNASFFEKLSTEHQKSKKWPGKLLQLNSRLSDRFIERLSGIK